VILQRGAADQTIAVYEARAGRIIEPFELSFALLAEDPRSAEQFLRQHLAPNEALGPKQVIVNQSDTPPVVIPSEATEGSDLVGRNLSTIAATPQADLSEHLWLLARWFYSNPRQGEIFFRANAWPYRRMMRACARLLAPPETKPSLPQQNKASQQDNLPQPGEEREKNS